MKKNTACMIVLTMILLFTSYLPVMAEEGASNDTEQTGSTENKDSDSGSQYALETMTVMATKTPKAPLDSPASVSIITKDDIDAFNSEHPFKPLVRTEGVWPRQYRGLADYWARPVIRGNRALVMVDGLNWYDYGQYYDTASIPMQDVDKMEVVRGPFSALYGTLAQTGVINYTTGIPRKMEIDASASYGEDNSKFYTARFADRPFDRKNGEDANWFDKNLGDGFFYSFSFKSRTTDGYVTTPAYKTLSSTLSGEPKPTIPIVTGAIKDIDPQTGATRYRIGDQGNNWYDDCGAFFKTGYEFSENSKIWYSLNRSQFEYGWEDGESSIYDENGSAVYNGSVYIKDGSDLYATSVNNSLFTAAGKKKDSLAHTLHFDYSTPGVVDIVALAGYNDKETLSHSESNATSQVEDNYLAQADLAATFHLMNNRLLLTVGSQAVKEDASDTTYNLSDPRNEDSHESIEKRTSGKNLTLAGFVQAEYAIIDSLTAYAGARYDYWWGTDTDYADIDGNYVKYDDVEDGQLSPKISLVQRLTENGVIRASYGESFTAPSLYYRIANYYFESGGEISMASGNPDLDPITNKSWEIGTEWEFFEKKLRVKTTYFQNDFEGLIVNITKKYSLENGTPVTEKMRVNAEDAEVDGIETSIEALLPYNLRAGIYYTHHWSEYVTLTAGSGHGEGWEVDEVPTDMLSCWIGYFSEYFDASISYRYSDKTYDDEKYPYASTVYKADDSYNVVDAQITVRPMDYLSVILSADNLFDEEYYEYYKSPGQTFMATVKISF